MRLPGKKTKHRKVSSRYPQFFLSLRAKLRILPASSFRILLNDSNKTLSCAGGKHSRLLVRKIEGAKYESVEERIQSSNCVVAAGGQCLCGASDQGNPEVV